MQIEELRSVIESIRTNRSQLIIVVSADEAASSSWASEVAQEAFTASVNVNFALSKALLEVPKAKRPLKTPGLFRDLINGAVDSISDREHGAVLLTNLELLFEPSLQLEPMSLLEGESRNQTVIVIWPGEKSGNSLTYASPGHPEFKKYSTSGLAIVELE